MHADARSTSRMPPRSLWVGALCMCVLGACRPVLPRAMIASHPALSAARLGPVVVESSAPTAPGWILRADRGAVDHVDFVGQASAPAVDTARAEALRDMLSAAANFVAVEVESNFESVETHDDGAESQQVRSSVRTHAQAALRDVHADAFYWERVAASSIDPSQTTVRYYVRARVPRAEITRARLQKQLDRQKSGGHLLVVVTPLVPLLDLGTDAAVGPLARALAEDLGRALAPDPALHVVEPSIVDAVLQEGTELERLEAIQNALLADRIVSGTLQRSGDVLRVRYTIRRGSADAPEVSGVVEGSIARLFELEAALAREVRAHLDVKTADRSTATPAAATPPPSDAARWSEAQRRHAEAWAALDAGQVERALTLAREALALRPDHALSLLRLGRILERLGRFGRIEPRAARAAQPSLVVCREESRSAAYAAIQRLRERALAHDQGSGLPAWIEPSTPTTDTILQLATVALSPSWISAAPEGSRPTAAASAYYSALVAARSRGDFATEQEALLALAELATRVDRAPTALLIDTALIERATAVQDFHLRSLARYGAGVAQRRLGRLDEAERLLQAALSDRLLLGEKPYFLEIYNELGGTEVERGRLDAARHWYRRAQHIAESLGAEYFRAVLANNLGVLAWREGRTREAEEGFAEAQAYLAARDDADGAVAALLNGAEAAARRGDPEAARARLDEAARRIEATDQEGRRAALAGRRGAFLMLSGDTISALTQHHEALSLAVALGQQATARRAHGAVLAAEARLPALSDSDLDCLRKAHRWLAAPAVPVESPQLDGAWDARLAVASTSEVALAHDAEVIDALAADVPEEASALTFDRVAADGVSWVEIQEVLVVLETSSDRRRRIEQPPPPPPRRPAPRPDVPDSVDVAPERPSQAPDRPSEPEARPTQPDARPSPADSAPVPGRTATGSMGEHRAVDDVAKAPAARAAPYERIVGAFDAESVALLLLSPADQPRLAHARFPVHLVAVAARARALHAPRVEAAARLNLGAILWRQGQERNAYAAMMAARRLFVSLGDAEGLAVTHEWLGIMLRDSAAIEPAAENLALARALYERIEDAARADRVLGWGD